MLTVINIPTYYTTRTHSHSYQLCIIHALPPFLPALSLSQVILDYEYIPHYDVHESEGVGVASVSDDSPLTPSSQPFSPITLSGDTPNSAHYRRQQNHTHSEGYGTAESGITEQQYVSCIYIICPNYSGHFNLTQWCPD